MTMTYYSRPGTPNPYSGQTFASANSSPTLYEMAGALLALVRSIYTTAGESLPERQVIYPAPIPADCEQIAVLFNGWTGFPSGGSEATRTEMFRWAGGFSVAITRKTPALAAPLSKNPTPPVESMKLAALMASKDAEMLLTVVRSLDEFSDVSVVVQAPVGGLQTVELDITIPAAGGGL